MNKILRKMDKIFGSGNRYSPERRDYKQFSDLQGRHHDSMAEFRQVVFVGFPNLLDQAMGTKAFEHSSDLLACFADEVFLNSAIAQTADIEFAPYHGLEQIQILAVEQVEAANASPLIVDGSRHLFEIFGGRSRIIEGREKVEVASVGRPEQFGQRRHTVDTFGQRRILHFVSAVPMFHPAVVLKKGQVVDGGFDPQHQAVLVVHFDGHRSHVMFNPCSLDTGVEVIAHFILIVSMQASSQKGGNVVGLDGMDRRPDQFIVKGGQIALASKHQVGGIFGLQDTPVIALLEMPDDRADLTGIAVENLMNTFGIQVVGQFLRPAEVVQSHKAVVQHRRRNAVPGQLGRQVVMAVEIDLKTKRRPGRNAKITQPQLGVDEIEVVMQAFAAVKLEKGFVRVLVMPGRKTGAGFHGRKDVDQTGMVSSLGQDLLNPLFLSKVLFADEIDGKAVLGREGFGVLSDLFPQGLCPAGVIKDPNPVAEQISRHALRIADTGDCSGQNDAVKAGNDTLNLVVMPFHKVLHARLLIQNGVQPLSENRAA
jgi:hypothetical protein